MVVSDRNVFKSKPWGVWFAYRNGESGMRIEKINIGVWIVLESELGYQVKLFGLSWKKNENGIF